MFCIVGGSGFIGSRLSQRFSSACVPFKIIDIAVSNPFPDLCQFGDVRDIDSLRRSIPENSSIINLAAEHLDDIKPVSRYHEVNVDGAHNLCTVAREKKIRTIIFTSSVAVYGFAPVGTGESGVINPFNDYGRTKFEAEQIFKAWQCEAPDERVLVIIRPTVVFGEQNRGNVYNLLSQIVSRRFVMIGDGQNRKSMAYVENVAAFIEHCLSAAPGAYIYNYVDKPDFTMNQLVMTVKRALGRSEIIYLSIPYLLGYWIGKLFDFVSTLTRRKFIVSSIRVKKFCAESVYSTAVKGTGFIRPVPLAKALERTIRHEFVEEHQE